MLGYICKGLQVADSNGSFRDQQLQEQIKLYWGNASDPGGSKII